MAPRLAIKVDVDTLEGFCQGVPALMEVLEDHAVKASFFLALGPDHSGRAIFRIFRQRGFLEKMWRTRAPALYGFKTMCYGTLLPGPKIGARRPAPGAAIGRGRPRGGTARLRPRALARSPLASAPGKSGPGD